MHIIDPSWVTLRWRWNALYNVCIVWQGFKKFLDNMLHSLARKVRLPDTEFLFNLGDWPQVKRVGDDGAITSPAPVFAWYAYGATWLCCTLPLCARCHKWPPGIAAFGTMQGRLLHLCG